MSFWKELKNRNVFRMGAAYAVVAWLLVQVAVSVLPVFRSPEWILQAFIVLLVLGFPIALALAWALEFRLDGAKPGSDIDQSTARRRSHKVDFIIAGLVAATVVFVVVDWFARDQQALDRDSVTTSVAVLAFENMSGDVAQEYFSDGISEELLNVLARIPELRVSSRTSSFSFKGKDIDLPTIAATLNVDHILEGSVRKDGDRIRLTAQLIDVATDSHLWSKTYERDFSSIFSVQDDIALRVAEELKVVMLGDDGSELLTRRTDNVAAYEEYLKGLQAHRRGLPAVNLLEAQRFFRRAIALDPAFAQAYAQLAANYIGLGNFRAMPPAEAYMRADEAVRQALALDPNLADGHASRGWVQLAYAWDWAGAEQSFRRAIDIEPNSSTGYEGLSFALSTQGRLDEALTAAQTGYQLDPLSALTRMAVEEVYYKQRDYDAALVWANRVLELSPDDALNVAWLGIIGALRGDPAPDILHYADEASSMAPRDTSVALAVALLHAHLGNALQAEQIIARVAAMRDDEYVSAGFIAAVYANLNRADQAYEWFDLAYAEYDSWLFNLNYPDLDPLRADPRFEALLRRLRLPVAAYLSVRGAETPRAAR